MKSRSPRRSSRRRLRVGLAFLLPNILGFLAFTLVPLTLSLVLAFTDWDIQRHNLFRNEPLVFVGWENFERLFQHPRFWQYLGNTFFLMLGLPFAIAGSLGAALLLVRVSGMKTAIRASLPLAAVGMVLAMAALVAGGMSAAGIWILLALLAVSFLVGGIWTKGMLYRTLFYLPHFTAGVATFVLWKKLYNPISGPINQFLAPPLEALSHLITWIPGPTAFLVPAFSLVGVLVLSIWQAGRLQRLWRDGLIRVPALFMGVLSLLVPFGLCLHLVQFPAVVALLATISAGVIPLVWIMRHPRPDFPARPLDVGIGGEVALALFLIPLLGLLYTGVSVGGSLPALAEAGFVPPNWLGDFHWAKPALILMGLWAAIGSNNMILYLAGLSNIPPELYEAADIDGASPSQRFWSITWPQLAPITFFIAVMGVIYGLQGGFEMARTMTQGGPAGATTTLSYYIYMEGFETGRLGYASAVAWVLFVLVFVLSALNFRFGNRHVND